MRLGNKENEIEENKDFKRPKYHDESWYGHDNSDNSNKKVSKDKI